MCIIIDADMVHKVFAEQTQPDFIPLIAWIINEDGRMVYGGLNGRQIRECKLAKAVIQEWAKSGKAKQIDGVDEEQVYVQKNLIFRSNDPQIIALARKSGARVLCSGDRNLHMDFTDTRLVRGPRGRIYQNASHSDVLGHVRGCQNR
ncbi:MAG: hypothetical protein MIO92_04335 [Methanosarcinaceae archaeon]|nr:hypothetical protein [Methanosarcinaceae archaeon]